MKNELWITIKEHQQGCRLDQCLSEEYNKISRMHIQKLIRQGHVSLQETLLYKTNHKVSTGDVYHMIIPDPISMDLLPEPISLNILYEDNDILIIDKPAGLVVHPGAGTMQHTLVQALLFHCKESLSGINGVLKPGIVHRLDKGTSGLIVIAKTDQAHIDLAKQFEKRSIEKIYWAFVWGMPTPTAGFFEESIGRNPFERKKMAVCPTGRPALTSYRLLKTRQGISLLECKPHTGRTHQIRVHCAHHRHPLVGDGLYAGKSHPAIQRPALHAKELTLCHPIHKKTMRFTSPIPEDLTSLMKEVNL